MSLFELQTPVVRVHKRVPSHRLVGSKTIQVVASSSKHGNISEIRLVSDVERKDAFVNQPVLVKTFNKRVAFIAAGLVGNLHASRREPKHSVYFQSLQLLSLMHLDEKHILDAYGFLKAQTNAILGNIARN